MINLIFIPIDHTESFIELFSAYLTASISIQWWLNHWCIPRRSTIRQARSTAGNAPYYEMGELLEGKNQIDSTHTIYQSHGQFNRCLYSVFDYNYTTKLLLHQSPNRYNDYTVTGQWLCSHCWQLPAARWIHSWIHDWSTVYHRAAGS